MGGAPVRGRAIRPRHFTLVRPLGAATAGDPAHCSPGANPSLCHSIRPGVLAKGSYGDVVGNVDKRIDLRVTFPGGVEPVQEGVTIPKGQESNDIRSGQRALTLHAMILLSRRDAIDGY